MSDPQKILLIQLRRIGDVLMCTPALRALRTRLPKSYIAFLTERESANLLRFNPYLSELLVWDRNRYRNPFYSIPRFWQVRKGNFDVVIDFLGNPRSAYLSFFSGAKRKIGYDLPGRRILYNTIIKNEDARQYTALRKMKALQPLGIESMDYQLDFFIPPEADLFAGRFFKENQLNDNKLIVSISPVSRRNFNRWSLERYAQLSDWLILKFNAQVILLWGPQERTVVEEVNTRMKEKPVISQETKSLFELGAILRKCDLHIGNDNGTKHVAVAMGKPTITIYGPHDPLSWTYPDSSRHRFMKAEVDCPDCERTKHKCTKLSCLDKITVEEVQATFLKLLKSLMQNREEGFAKKIEHIAVD
ncbi:MAG TPA: glycosyltransferase family 9 protein [candidate division Zixibacteria bacterium]